MIRQLISTFIVLVFLSINSHADQQNYRHDLDARKSASRLKDEVPRLEPRVQATLKTSDGQFRDSIFKSISAYDIFMKTPHKGVSVVRAMTYYIQPIDSSALKLFISDQLEVQSKDISNSILAFGSCLVLMILGFHLFRKLPLDFNIVKLIGMIVIAVSSLYLVAAGFDDKQITPIVGLLGTLAGYLAGAQPQNGRTSDESHDRTPSAQP